MWSLWFGLLFAKITLVDYPKYLYTVDTTDPANILMYAGGTSQACASTSNTTTCNSCTNLSAFTGTPVCNTHQINKDLVFKVRIQSDNADLVKSPNGVWASINSTQVAVTYDTNQFKPNTIIDVSLTWSAICTAAAGSTASTTDANCLSSFASAPLLIGIGSTATSLTEYVRFTISHRYVSASPTQTFGCTGANSYEGFCYFSVYPGDEKVFVNASVFADSNYKAMDLRSGVPAGTATQDPSGMVYSALRIFYAKASSYSSITGTSSYKDLPFSAGNFKDVKITGLENGQQYVFLSATVDQAGNTTLFTNPSDAQLCPAADANCYSPPYQSADGKLSQTAIPNKVQGLLDEQKCFVATAAFGSSMEPHVQRFRDFRDRVLLQSRFGRVMVAYYYKHGPAWAEWIEKSEWRKTATRALLWPAWVIADFWLTFLETP